MRGRSGLANDTWESLLTAHARVMKAYQAEPLWREISMREYDVLYALSKCDQPIRLSELNRNVLLSQPALSRMVDRLVGRGLITREADPTDGRGVRLGLSELGREAQHRLGTRHAQSVTRAMTSRLTDAEMEQLEALCLKLAADA